MSTRKRILKLYLLRWPLIATFIIMLPTLFIGLAFGLMDIKSFGFEALIMVLWISIQVYVGVFITSLVPAIVCASYVIHTTKTHQFSAAKYYLYTFIATLWLPVFESFRPPIPKFIIITTILYVLLSLLAAFLCKRRLKKKYGIDLTNPSST